MNIFFSGDQVSLIIIDNYSYNIFIFLRSPPSYNYHHFNSYTTELGLLKFLSGIIQIKRFGISV